MKHIYDYLAEHAAITPRKTAITDENGAMTYAELDGKSSALALRLEQMKINPGDAVAVYVPYVKELILGAFAAMRAGGIYLPLEYTYPDDRLSFMLKDSSASALLTLRTFWAERPLDFPSERVIFMDDTSDSAPSVSADIPMDAPAMILYTSGTTGRPKGVILPHTMMVSLMDWAFIHEGTQLTEDSRIGIMSGLTFSATTLILYSPFIYGGTVFLAPEPVRKDMDLLYTFLRQNAVTHTFLPAGLATTIVEHYDMSGITIFAGGEKLRNFHPLSPETRLINTYGCTELGAVISAVIRGDEDVIPIGLLAPDTEAMIADDSLCPVPSGETGELLVRNARMARSYLGLPEQTKAKWVGINGKTWYRTGDRVRQSADGLYYILGRTDNMIKIRGFRVETGEVEAQIAGAAAKLGISLKNSIVVLRTVNGIDHLTCYYESPTEADTKLIMEKISVSLASYMVPDLWVRMDAMPRNANGKIIRSRLPQPKNNVSAVGTIFSEAEARVVETASHVLGISTYISPDDGFVSIGGTSLTAMELSSELREAGIGISSAEILKLDTLRKIAAKAEIQYERFWSLEEYERIRADFAARGEHIEKVLPITPEQDEALFELLLHPDRPGSRHVFMFQVDSVITKNELLQAADTVSAEFEQLRSSIVFHKVSVIQQVITDRTVPVQIIEYPEENYAALKELYNTLSRKYCNLQKESSVQIVCVNMAKESFIFILDYTAGINMPAARRYIARMMELLRIFHPEDETIASWIDLLKMPLPAVNAKKGTKRVDEVLKRTSEKHRRGTEDLHIYSDLPGKKKLIFVHTGNTGSEAYYSLADRIRSNFSFAVLEPFNLYHPAEAKYGIRSIAAQYIDTLKKFQPEGPYILGGWCYGGIVAHEMACQLQAMGEKIEYLFLLDSHVILDERVRKVAEIMHSSTNREYFESSDLFEDMRQDGMLDALVENSRHVSQDMMSHVPSHYVGPCLYFKPKEVPAATGGAGEYWNLMKDEYEAGGYESYCSKELLTVIETPHEHDLMMDSESLNLIVPEICRVLLSD